MQQYFPERIESETELEQVLTQPSEQLKEAITQVQTPLIVIGAGGKMGPSLSVLAKRAAIEAGHDLEVIAVSRFSNPDAKAWLEARGVTTFNVDVLQASQVNQLPLSNNVVYLVGMKFGTSQAPAATWATNTIAPVRVADRYAGSKIVALSTGNVYPLTNIASGGSVETDPLTPIGEYANAAVARERVFGYFAEATQTPTVMVRLNYAHDLRYGVLTDIALKVLREQPIDLTMGYFNAIWQGDANEMILRCFPLCDSPINAINLSSYEIFRVRDVAERFAKLLGRTPSFVGQESPTALLCNASRMRQQLGYPSVSMDQMAAWIADWIQQEQPLLGKPTHFETRDGKY